MVYLALPTLSLILRRDELVTSAWLALRLAETSAHRLLGSFPLDVLPLCLLTAKSHCDVSANNRRMTGRVSAPDAIKLWGTVLKKERNTP